MRDQQIKQRTTHRRRGLPTAKIVPICYLFCMLLFASLVFCRYISPDRSTLPDASEYGSGGVMVSSIPWTENRPFVKSPVAGPGVSAQAAAVMDARSGALLYGKNETMKLPMASTTKIMTALIVLDKLPLDQLVSVDARAVGVEGSSIYLYEGENMTVENLLYGLMLESGNDAAAALAIATAGSEDAFAELMNQKAQELGLVATHFTNPHGLTAQEHYTTAAELAAITSKALENETFRMLVSTKKLLVPTFDGKAERLFVNHNKMLRLYDGAIGVKTGYTKAAGRCLVTAAERDGETYIAVTLNDGNDWNDHAAMLNYAFDHYDSVLLAEKEAFQFPTEFGMVTNKRPLYLTVGQGETVTLAAKAEVVDGMAGTLTFYADGRVAAQCELSLDEWAWPESEGGGVT